MKKILLALLGFLTLISCKESEELIHYSYNDVTITRLNKENEIYFYFGNHQKLDSLPNSFIKVSSFDGCMQGFLIFRESGHVEVIKEVGSYVDEIKDSSMLNLVTFNHNVDFINWNESINGKYKNILRFDDIQNIEIKINKKNNSEVASTWNKKL